MRIILSAALLSAASPAMAHIGHLGEAAGHGHWIGLGAIALAGVIGALAAKGRGKKQDPAPETEDTREEAPA